MLSQRIEELLLKNEFVSEGRKLVSQYEFLVPQIPDGPKIIIRIYIYPEQRQFRYMFDQSHYAHTPTQVGPYCPSAPFYESEELALDRAISSITMYVQEAIRAGHEPHTSWLVTNQFH